jgi:tRNA modification GTPase
MPRSYIDPPLPVAALATSPGEAALAVVRTSGPGCIELAGRVFSRPATLRAAPGHSGVYGEIVDPASGEAVDQVLAFVYRAPRSPTGEDQVEFSCHGSPAVVRRLLDILERIGFAQALPGEFSFRAFVNGKIDLVRAEAVNELVRARSDAAREDALERLEGGLSSRLEAARARLLAILAEVELRLDYGEDEIGGLFPEDASPDSGVLHASLLALRDELLRLSATYAAGRLVSEGLRAAFAGAPNVGKSRLFNLFLREERSIVSPEPGTTRDWIEAEVELEGLRLRLIDTAGLRRAVSAVEAEGVARSERILAEAELLLFLVDASLPDAAAVGEALAEAEALRGRRPDALFVWNKIDISPAGGHAPGRGHPEGFFPVSAATGQGFPELAAALARRAREIIDAPFKTHEGPAGGSAVGLASTAGPGKRPPRLASARQKGLLDRAAAAIDAAAAALGAGSGLDAAALDLREAADALGEITGEITTPEILEAIFSRFCVGK